MNLTLGSEEAFSEKTVSQILQRVQSEITAEKDALLQRERAEHLAEAGRITKEAEAKVEAERKRALAMQEQLDDIVAKHSRTSKRLYWIADRASGFVTFLVVSAITLLLVAGSFFIRELCQAAAAKSSMGFHTDHRCSLACSKLGHIPLYIWTFGKGHREKHQVPPSKRSSSSLM
jgi:hypothetical protein